MTEPALDAEADDELDVRRECPRCDAPVISVTTIGPTDHILGPCGCRVGTLP